MQVEEKLDVTYIGDSKEQIEKLREVVETPLLSVSHRDLALKFHLLTSLQPERFVNLGIDLPKGGKRSRDISFGLQYVFSFSSFHCLMSTMLYQQLLFPLQCRPTAP